MCITVRFICEKALEIAAGLEFLARQNVVHGDLAARTGFIFAFYQYYFDYFKLNINPKQKCFSHKMSDR